MFNNLCTSTAVLAALLPFATSIPTISAVGSKFFDSNGSQFYVKGIAYQRSEEDPLTDPLQCQLDATLMKELGANAIRVYHVDEKKEHDECMKTFEEAGIYLFLDLDTFDTRIEPEATHWNRTQFDRFAAVLDAFHSYDNLAGVFVGNEVLAKADQATAAIHVKAAVADVKSYRDKEEYRKIPVGYSAADILELHPVLQNYLACGSDRAQAVDFYGLNSYEWCSSSVDFATSGYSRLQDDTENYPVPIFFSETGCMTSPPRQFQDQSAIFGEHMNETWSGAIVYEWIQEANHYGLITYKGSPGPDGVPRMGKPEPVVPDFDNLKQQWATLNPTGVKLADYKASASRVKIPDCPRAKDWSVNGNPPLPTLGLDYSVDSEPAKSTKQPDKPGHEHDEENNEDQEADESGNADAEGSASYGKEITRVTSALGFLLGLMAWL